MHAGRRVRRRPSPSPRRAVRRRQHRPPATAAAPAASCRGGLRSARRPAQPCESTVVCGDGKVNGTEHCDDGNTARRRRLLAGCKLESGWTCPTPGGACRRTRCGDGITRRHRAVRRRQHRHRRRLQRDLHRSRARCPPSGNGWACADGPGSACTPHHLRRRRSRGLRAVRRRQQRHLVDGCTPVLSHRADLPHRAAAPAPPRAATACCWPSTSPTARVRRRQHRRRRRLLARPARSRRATTCTDVPVTQDPLDACPIVYRDFNGRYNDHRPTAAPGLRALSARILTPSIVHDDAWRGRHSRLHRIGTAPRTGRPPTDTTSRPASQRRDLDYFACWYTDNAHVQQAVVDSPDVLPMTARAARLTSSPYDRPRPFFPIDGNWAGATPGHRANGTAQLHFTEARSWFQYQGGESSTSPATTTSGSSSTGSSRSTSAACTAPGTGPSPSTPPTARQGLRLPGRRACGTNGCTTTRCQLRRSRPG